MTKLKKNVNPFLKAKREEIVDLVTTLISLISGALGGNATGAVMKEKSMSTLGNSVTGAVGGGLGGLLMQALGLLGNPEIANAAGQGVEHLLGNLDLQALLSSIGGGAGGGVVLTILTTLLKSYLKSR